MAGLRLELQMYMRKFLGIIAQSLYCGDSLECEFKYLNFPISTFEICAVYYFSICLNTIVFINNKVVFLISSNIRFNWEALF